MKLYKISYYVIKDSKLISDKFIKEFLNKIISIMYIYLEN